MNIAGIDIGTTGCKCSVYNDLGNLIATAYQEYSTNISETSHTIDPDMIFDSLKIILKQIAKTCNEIEAIGVSSFGEASVLLDKDSKVLAPAFLFTDPNGQKECDDIIESLSENYIYHHTGLQSGKMFSAPKWKFIKNKSPDIYKKVKYIMLIEDFIVYRLTGIRQIDYSLATRTMAFDIENLDFNSEILSLTGIKKDMLSKPVPFGTAASKIKNYLSAELGFKKPPLIVSGCHDQVAAAVGCGLLSPFCSVDGTGTVECLTSTFIKSDKINEEKLREAGYAIVPYLNGMFITYAFSYTGGALLKWYRDKMSSLESKGYKKNNINPYKAFDGGVDDSKPSGLLILPYFAGAGTPYMNSHACGVIYGLTLDTEKGKIYQGLLEGATYELKLNLEKLDDSGIKINTLYATGGGATSEKWLQMKADITGRKIITVESSESGTLGSIMLACVACGLFKNLDDAAKVFVKYKKIYTPRKEQQKLYQEQFNKYKQLYPNLKALMGK